MVHRVQKLVYARGGSNVRVTGDSQLLDHGLHEVSVTVDRDKVRELALLVSLKGAHYECIDADDAIKIQQKEWKADGNSPIATERVVKLGWLLPPMLRSHSFCKRAAAWSLAEANVELCARLIVLLRIIKIINLSNLEVSINAG